MRRVLFPAFVFCGFCACAQATVIVGGAITQSTADGTGPAVNNPSLNAITDLEAFTLTLDTPLSIAGAGVYDLTGASLVFSVPGASASESSFGTASLSVTESGGLADFSLFACVAGADCTTGNSLSASFEIPVGSFGGTGVAAVGLDQPHPFELLEDDGITDIHGSITSYSNTAAVPTPELPSGLLTGLSVLGVSGIPQFRNRRTFRRRLP